jgi:glycosyltransferase involved in cell wall biosynthesis
VVRSLARELAARCADATELALIVRDDPTITIEDERLRRCDTILVRGRIPGWQNVAWGGRWLRHLGADVGFFQYFSPHFSPVPRVSHIHDILVITHPGFFTLRERAYFSPLTRNARRADAIVTVSASERDRILDARIVPADRVFVVHNGVDDAFKPVECRPERDLVLERMRSRLPSEFVLYCGRINARKNVSTLLHAMAILGSRRPPLVLVGEPEWRQEGFEPHRRALLRTGRLLELGGLNDEDLAATYALATVFCYPSKEEAFGLPNLEAMSCGTPVVASDIPAHREVCGDAAVFVDPNDAHALATAIDELLHNDTLRARQRASGLGRARRLSWALAAEQLTEVLRTLQ